jgi:SAM-dependent methyltransferase
VASASWDPVWEQVFRSQAWAKYPPEHVVRFVARNWYSTPKRADVRLLEIGCGPGANIWYMSREGFSAAGIDGSATAVDLAQKRLRDEGLAADLCVGDFTRLPWPDNSFDGALDNVSLYTNRRKHFRAALEEVRRVLKPGGKALSATFSTETWGYGLGEEVEPGGFIDITEGPMAGKGFSLFLGRDEIDDLYSGLEILGIEKFSWTTNNMKNAIVQWLITCQKR